MFCCYWFTLVQGFIFTTHHYQEFFYYVFYFNLILYNSSVYKTKSLINAKFCVSKILFNYIRSEIKQTKQSRKKHFIFVILRYYGNEFANTLLTTVTNGRREGEAKSFKKFQV